MITMFSDRDFRRGGARAMEATSKGPVVITEGGRPKCVLLSIADYEKLSARKITLGDMLAMDDAELIDEGFDFPRIG